MSKPMTAGQVVFHASAGGHDVIFENAFWSGSIDALFDFEDLPIQREHIVKGVSALVALPEDMRNRYVAHLTEITKTAPQLLICYEYDQGLMEGPPFSVSNEEVHQKYRDIYDLTLLASANVPGGLKGIVTATENVWLLK